MHGRNLDSRDIALQILNIVALCPELEICYTGIHAKCFEILETKPNDKNLSSSDITTESPGPGHGDSDIDSEVDEEDGEDNHDNATSADPPAEPEDTDSDLSSIHQGESDDEEDFSGGRGRSGVQLRLREILFYDDKVSIFKARHGRL